MVTTRRQFSATIIATLVTAPLVRLGWIKPPRPVLAMNAQLQSYMLDSIKDLFKNSRVLHAQYLRGSMGGLSFRDPE